MAERPRNCKEAGLDEENAENGYGSDATMSTRNKPPNSKERHGPSGYKGYQATEKRTRRWGTAFWGYLVPKYQASVTLPSLQASHPLVPSSLADSRLVMRRHVLHVLHD